MNVTDEWSLIVELTETSLIPGNLSTSRTEKTFLAEPVRYAVSSLDPRAVLRDFGRNKRGEYGFLGLVAEEAGLNSLEGLDKYPLVERLDLSKNAISDVSPVGALPNLYSLSLADNRVLALAPGILRRSLVFINLSNNLLDSFPDLAQFECLRELDLSGNSLTAIVNSAPNQNLRKLRLAGNQIKDFARCRVFANLTDLDIAGCSFESLDYAGRFPRLERLAAGGNRIASLAGVGELANLSSASLTRNRIRDLSEVFHLQGLRFLKSLDLGENPCQGINFYLYLMLHALPQLLWLDGTEVTTKSRAETDVFFGKDLDRRQAIFERHLPQETFVDSRVYRVENVVVHRDMLDDAEQQDVEAFQFRLD